MRNPISQKSLKPNGTAQPSHQPQVVNFKKKPTIIPRKAIEKNGEFSNRNGGLADVWMCFWRQKSSWHQKSRKCKVAVKSIRILQADDKELVEKIGKRIRREAYVWTNFNHGNILKFLGIVEGFGPLPALVSPWMENGSLDLTFNSCHAGNVRWMAPEMLAMPVQEGLRMPEQEGMTMPEQGGVIKPTKAADIYSYGCIMLQLFSGQLPYSWLKQANLVNAARVGGIEPFPARQIASVKDGHKRYSLRCISNNSGDRPDVSGIMEFLDEQSS
ncbi:kinase-like protein [Rhizopogon vinicolor AM-OR11-026]|uniref:Kinase-like protein n=1 Tax=Rhizopogon vinicolor AM-OR11-026 TaxID=1314800 RepID=A0A1B7MHY4_9AGAM|nr:kinase-like protein [Rhizopogon vinicolor AM-OR11-026]